MVRPPLGELVDRTVMSTQLTRQIPGAPDGDYALLEFRTSFAKKTNARETVTLEREADDASAGDRLLHTLTPAGVSRSRGNELHGEALAIKSRYHQRPWPPRN